MAVATLKIPYESKNPEYAQDLKAHREEYTVVRLNTFAACEKRLRGQEPFASKSDLDIFGSKSGYIENLRGTYNKLAKVDSWILSSVQQDVTQTIGAKEVRRKLDLGTLAQKRKGLVSLESEIIKLSASKKQKDLELVPLLKRKAERIQAKIEKLESKTAGWYKDCFGGSQNLSNYNRYLNLEALETDEAKKAEYTRLKSQAFSAYQDKRLAPYFSVGETLHRGNRKFDFSDLGTLKVIWKPNAKAKYDLQLKPQSGNYKYLLKLIQSKTSEKLLPITVSLDDNFIYITVDLDKLLEQNVDEKSRAAEVKALKAENEITKALTPAQLKEAIKDIYKKYYRLSDEKKLKRGNSNKDIVLAVDLNPEALGFSVIKPVRSKYKPNQLPYKVLYTFGFNYDHKKLDANQRKHYLSNMLTKAFSVGRRFKCGVFGIEDLDFKHQDSEMSSTAFNRLKHNLWNLNYLQWLVEKHCALNGMLLTKVNPAYSSFMGNLLNDYWDPIASSIEIGRRAGLMKSKDQMVSGSGSERYYHELIIQGLLALGALSSDSIDRVMIDKMCGKPDGLGGYTYSTAKLFQFANAKGLRYRRSIPKNTIKQKSTMSVAVYSAA